MPLPNRIFRAFDKSEFAEDFVEFGALRFSNVRTYKESEDSGRADRSEGFAEYEKSGMRLIVDAKTLEATEVPGTVHVRVDGGLDATFISCFSAPKSQDPLDVPEQFGSYVVEVKSPEILFWQLQNCVKHHRSLSIHNSILKSAFVDYDKGQRQQKTSGKDDETLSWSQKPPRYKVEQEYRFSFLVPPGALATNYFSLVVCQPLPYATIHYLPKRNV